ncbi:hypothetical protein GCM10007856_01180 [Azospirillum oryzae]|nr:hypothetical protein GCM10007856_01180 [Azospirillum oryzae]
MGYPREEPGAGKPHARICEGESQMAELLDRYHHGKPKTSCANLTPLTRSTLPRSRPAASPAEEHRTPSDTTPRGTITTMGVPYSSTRWPEPRIDTKGIEHQAQKRSLDRFAQA